MKLRKVFELDGALSSLDIINRETGTAVYVFKGAVRMSLARKMRVVKDAIADYKKARAKVEAEMGYKPDDQEKNPERFAALNTALGEMLDAEADIDLGTKLKVDDLDLDRNSIPTGLLIHLAPVLAEAI